MSKQTQSNEQQIRLTFVDHDGDRKQIAAEVGESILEVAHRHGICLEGACEGSLACATCHVVVEPGWHARLPDASEEEEDMLDLALDLTRTSRLGCQLVIQPEWDGLVLAVPSARHKLGGACSKQRADNPKEQQ